MIVGVPPVRQQRGGVVLARPCGLGGSCSPISLPSLISVVADCAEGPLNVEQHGGAIAASC